MLSSQHLAPSWPVSVPVHRACYLCTHGTGQGADRMCTCPAVASPARQVPIEVARRPHGPCGPEAVYLSFPGLHG